jgi:uncharacterized membrane protein YkvA (DUF1232 family)
MKSLIENLKAKTRDINQKLYILYLAYQHPSTQWYAKAFAVLVIGYALSPIDLIPDFIPILGYLDDLLLVSLGIFLALKMIPQEALIFARKKAETEREKQLPHPWIVGVIIVMIWVTLISLAVIWTIRLVRNF